MLANQVATYDTVRQKFGGGSALLNLHDRMADTLLVATALSAEGPGESPVPTCSQSMHHDIYGFASSS